MILRKGLEVGAKHHLFIGGCDAAALAEEYGTPLYVVDEVYLRDMCKAFVGAMNTYAPGGMVCYASKAFSCTAMVHIAKQERMGLDVVSGGELYTALKANFPMDRVTFHGNCKTPAEIAMALDLNVGHIAVDNRSEIPILQRIAAEMGKQVKVLLRLNPGIDAHTHSAVKTATLDCKFGLGIDDGEAQLAVGTIANCKNLTLDGVHVHIGSQIFEIEPYLEAVDRLTDFMMLATAITGRELSDIVIGGGFGVRYTQADPPTSDPYTVVKLIAQEVERKARRKGLAVPRLVLEPGRIIVAEAGVMLYTVSSIKHLAGIRTYVGVDGGMMDNLRPALYGARYEALLANRADERPSGKYTIAGRACESGDLLGTDFRLPAPQVGDILAMPTAGAYQYSMANNYNRVPVPAVVLARYGKSAPIVRRQTYEDITQYDEMPSWLR